jgi:hypothetical protein
VLRPQGGYIRGWQSGFDLLPRTRTPDHIRKNDAVCPILTRFPWNKMQYQGKRQITEDLLTWRGPRTLAWNYIDQSFLGVRVLGGGSTLVVLYCIFVRLDSRKQTARLLTLSKYCSMSLYFSSLYFTVYPKYYFALEVGTNGCKP